MVRQIKWTLIVWILLTAVSFADGPDFFDLSWGDELVGREWVVERNASVQQIISGAVYLADTPPSMIGKESAADAFRQWQRRQDWSRIQVYQRMNERPTVAGFRVEAVRYYTIDGLLVAVEVSFADVYPERIADAMRTRYGSARDTFGMVTYEDERTRATFLIRLLTLESVQHLRAFGEQIYADFLAEYEATASRDDLW